MAPSCQISIPSSYSPENCWGSIPQMPPSASRLVITLALTELCNYSPPGSEVQPARRVFVLFCVCSVLKPFPEPLGRPSASNHYKCLQEIAPQPGLLLRHTDREMLSEVTFSKLLLLWVVKPVFRINLRFGLKRLQGYLCVIILSFLYLRAGAKPPHNCCALLCSCFCCLFCFPFFFFNMKSCMNQDGLELIM